jgi:hypothetical protein
VHCHGAEHGTIRSVPVILFLAAAAILGCVVLAAMGMGGEMAAFPTDSAPLRMDEVTAADVALLRPPLALWGYSVPATEEALGVIARAVTVRDTEIAALRQELAGLQTQRQPGEHPAYDEAPAHGEVPPQGDASAHDDMPAYGEPPAYGELPGYGEVPAYGDVPEHDDGSPGPARDEAPAAPAYDEAPAHDDVPAAPAYDEAAPHNDAHDDAHGEVPAWPAAPEPGSGD